MNPAVVVFVLLFVAIGVAITAAGLRRVYHAGLMWRNEPVPISDATRTSAPVEFEGTARPLDEGQTVLAPFEGEEALLFTYEVERKERKNRSNSRGSRTTWKTVASGEVTRPFVVEDDSGGVRVDPEEATIAPANEEQKASTGSALSDRVRLRLSALTEEFDLDSILPQATSKQRRFTEGHIAPGDQVHVYGAAVEQHSTPRGEMDGRVSNSAGKTVYRISAGDEATAVRRKSLGGLGLIAFGLFVAGSSSLGIIGPMLGW